MSSEECTKKTLHIVHITIEFNDGDLTGSSGPLLVSCAKLRRKKSLFGSIYVEVTVDGETRRTAKSHSSSNPKWDERLTL